MKGSAVRVRASALPRCSTSSVARSAWMTEATGSRTPRAHQQLRRQSREPMSGRSHACSIALPPSRPGPCRASLGRKRVAEDPQPVPAHDRFEPPAVVASLLERRDKHWIVLRPLSRRVRGVTWRLGPSRTAAAHRTLGRWTRPDRQNRLRGPRARSPSPRRRGRSGRSSGRWSEHQDRRRREAPSSRVRPTFCERHELPAHNRALSRHVPFSPYNNY